MFGPRSAALLVMLASMTTACRPTEGVVARLGGHEVRTEEFQAHLEAVTGLPWQDVDSLACSHLLDQFLEQEAVVVAAGKRIDDLGRSREPRLAVIRRFTSELCGPAPEVPADRIAHEVDSRMARGDPEKIHLRQLLVETLEAATDVRRRLAEGEDYDALSFSVSRAPNANRGGELGWFARGTLPENVEEAVFDLEVGDYSEPVGGPGGYHLFHVLEIKEAGTPSLERVRAEVELELEAQLAQQHLEECLRRTVDDVGLQLIQQNLWFKYSGKYSEVTDDE